MAKKTTPMATVMTDEPIAAPKKARAARVSTPTVVSPVKSVQRNGDHDANHIHMMYLIMVSFLLSLMAAGVVWLALDMRISSIESSLRIQSSVDR